MSTPEGRVKTAIKRLLDEYGAYHYMPVTSGMGAPQLDFICHMRTATPGLAIVFYVEAKAPGKKPTARQANTIQTLWDSGASVFVIDSPKSKEFAQLRRFLEKLAAHADLDRE